MCLRFRVLWSGSAACVGSLQLLRLVSQFFQRRRSGYCFCFFPPQLSSGRLTQRFVLACVEQPVCQSDTFDTNSSAFLLLVCACCFCAELIDWKMQVESEKLETTNRSAFTWRNPLAFTPFTASFPLLGSFWQRALSHARTCARTSWGNVPCGLHVGLRTRASTFSHGSLVMSGSLHENTSPQ